MIKRHEYIEYYWNDYMGHERRFANLCDYVALHQQNLTTCSDEIISQLLLVCTSFEASMKAMYTFQKQRPNVEDYLEALESDELFDSNIEIHLLEGKLLSARKPFSGACPSNSPAWWKAYNKVKHNRAESYEQGTFEHLIDALAALYYINMIHAKIIGDYWHGISEYAKSDNAVDVPNDISRFFRINDWQTRETVFGRNAYALSNEDLDSLINACL